MARAVFLPARLKDRQLLPANDQSTAKFYAVPSFVPRWGWAEFWIAIRCFFGGRLIAGHHSGRLCELVQTEIGLPYAVTVNRARYAIQLALEAMEIGPGGEVIVPSYVCDAVLEPIRNVGATPVFAEVGPDLHLTVETVRRAITHDTRAVIVPHLFGNVAPIDEIEELLRGTNIRLIDDAAQAFGARCAGRLVGTFGACGVLALGPGKSLAGPAGGILVTRDRALYERASSNDFPRENRLSVIRRLGAFWVWFRFRRFFLGFKGFSDRALPQGGKSGDRPAQMSNLDAMIALRQVKTWERSAQRRRRIAKDVLDAMRSGSVGCISDLSPAGLVLRLVFLMPSGGDTAARALRSLEEAGIEARSGYEPLHRTPRATRLELPQTESLARRVLLLPLSDRLLSSRRRHRALEQVSRRYWPPEK